MLVEVWSDVVCPWCYIGKRRLERALAEFEHRESVEVAWRSFELDPRAPREAGGAYAERLAAKYRTSVAEAESMMARMVEAAAGEGIEVRFDIARTGNSFDAHRLLHLAAAHARQPALKERLLAATFTEGRPVGDPATLQQLAEEAGLPGDAVERVLGSDDHASKVRADEAEAAALGITGVPCFVIDRNYAVDGAQPPALLLDVLRRAWSERSAATSE